MSKECALLWRISAISNLRDGAILHIPFQEDVKTSFPYSFYFAVYDIHGRRNIQSTRIESVWLAGRNGVLPLNRLEVFDLNMI